MHINPGPAYDALTINRLNQIWKLIVFSFFLIHLVRHWSLFHIALCLKYSYRCFSLVSNNHNTNNRIVSSERYFFTESLRNHFQLATKNKTIHINWITSTVLSIFRYYFLLIIHFEQKHQLESIAYDDYTLTIAGHFPYNAISECPTNVILLQLFDQ